MFKTKKIFYLSLLLITLFFGVDKGWSQSIYSISFSNIDGGSISLSSFTGKKIVLFIAPFSSSDSAQIKELRLFQQQFGVDTVAYIGIMSIEDGYTTSNTAAIKAMYEAMGVKDVVLTAGMHTRKSAGSSQSALLKWLTEKDQNSIYDIDAQGIGQKFFVGKSGRLYGVLPPRFSFLNPTVSSTFLRRQ